MQNIVFFSIVHLIMKLSSKYNFIQIVYFLAKDHINFFIFKHKFVLNIKLLYFSIIDCFQQCCLKKFYWDKNFLKCKIKVFFDFSFFFSRKVFYIFDNENEATKFQKGWLKELSSKNNSKIFRQKRNKNKNKKYLTGKVDFPNTGFLKFISRPFEFQFRRIVLFVIFCKTF